MYYKTKVKIKDIHHSFPKGGYRYGDEGYDFEGLKNTIVTNGYNPQKFKYILVSLGGTILNGHHRKEVLTELYGEGYEVVVKRCILPFVFILLFWTLTYCFIKLTPKSKPSPNKGYGNLS